ncbi:MAG: hydroxypyruvate isomerase [Gammaproteobacteria bacterium HGW-Gammaproteobacteria-9]|nr:MAG: hydroxypyruvate isomerase [Gammaproteobacteria bacterium HGW-Gammaproteobacteria-9]
MPRFAANLSMLFTEQDFTDRFAAAAAAGFTGVEYLFPYDYPAEEIKARLDANKLTQVLFNLPAGDWASGERGVNCLAGIAPRGADLGELEMTFIENLRYAAQKLEEAGIRLVMEMINTRDIPRFFLNNTSQAQEIRGKVGHPNLFLQYDIYHMQIMEGDLARTIEANLDAINHIQLADNPGRNEPGTGEINYHFLFEHLDRIGYQGWVGCEYKPATTTEAGLGWLKSHNAI